MFIYFIFFYNNYLEGFNQEHDDLMVISTTIHNYAIKRILVDQESLMNILYNATATCMNITKSDLKPYNGNLIRFFGKQVFVEGIMRLRVTLGTWLVVINMDVNFLTVDILNSTYNAILG